MAKNLPKCPEPPSSREENASKKVYRIHVVTPLVGGGVEAGKNDPITLIRGASIRGQLRFWWRASKGSQFSDSKSLYQKEGEIWGTSKSPSPVSIEVREIQSGIQDKCAEFLPDTRRGGLKNFPEFKDVPGYVMFPFQGKVERGEVKQQPATITRSASFSLEITVPETHRVDVEAAVWAWCNFGGLGARTRRGCGSLFCEELAPNRQDINAWYQEKLGKYGIVLSGAIPDWPVLPTQLLLQLKKVNPLTAWENVVRLLKDFRQGEGVGRNPGQQNRPGRSRWPEADSLRRITGKSCRQHATPITTTRNAFPRAELGLPIVFHFKDAKDGDPQDSELYPSGGFQRMASPLILKSLALQKSQAIPMIMCLRTQPVMGVELKKVPRSPALGASDIRRPDLAAYPNSPMAGLSSHGSALEAFLNFARQNGFC